MGFFRPKWAMLVTSSWKIRLLRERGFRTVIAPIGMVRTSDAAVVMPPPSDASAPRVRKTLPEHQTDMRQARNHSTRPTVLQLAGRRCVAVGSSRGEDGCRRPCGYPA